MCYVSNHLLKFVSMKYCWVVLLVFCSGILSAQTFTDSNLPIVIIQIDKNASIRDTPRVYGNMKVVYRGDGARTYVSDQDTESYLQYNGRISIEIRGSSSQALPKKQYGLTTLKQDDRTNNNVSILGMPSENDWILNGLAYDPSLLRDYLTYNLMRRTGTYAPRTHYCEVIINGDYKGLYVFQEKIKADKDRVKIIKIEHSDNVYPNVTGGYITKADKPGTDPVAWTMPTYSNAQVLYIHQVPKPGEILTIQHNYIKSQFEDLASRAMNESISSGFPTIIDVKTFVDFMLINELTANVDAYQISTYFHKDRGGKLRAGPIWDFNFSYGNDLYTVSRSLYNTWQFDNGDNLGSKFWKDLFTNPTFKCYLAKRFAALTSTGNVFHQEYIATFIDEIIALIGEAKEREHARWGTLEHHEADIQQIKDFIGMRIAWMIENLGAYDDCQVINLPSLVINRIHYHPNKYAAIADEELLEFVSVMNAGSEPVPLAGVFFSELPFTYQFPPYMILDPGEEVYIARDAEAFKKAYGFAPLGVYHQHLSNSNQKIVLSDAFGNVIDEVHYVDKNPWPDADGNGKHLKLIDPTLDNALPENWTTDVLVLNDIVPIESPELMEVAIYPNPTHDIITITSGKLINRVDLLDLHGVCLFSEEVNSKQLSVNLSKYARGEYIVLLYVRNRGYTYKVVRY
jgi:hypothetical protein